MGDSSLPFGIDRFLLRLDSQDPYFCLHFIMVFVRDQERSLGLFEDWDCMLEERQLFPGDTLVLYADGMTESFNDSGEEFGEQRLIEALRRHRGESSQALVSSLLDEVRQFNPNEQQDDITLIVANCRECIEPI